MHLAELESMLFTGELEVTGDKDEHATSRARGLTIDCGDAVLALLEGKASKLSDDVLGALDLLALESKHGSLLVEIGQTRPIGVESGVIVLDEGLGHRVWIHLEFDFPTICSLCFNWALLVCFAAC